MKSLLQVAKTRRNDKNNRDYMCTLFTKQTLRQYGHYIKLSVQNLSEWYLLTDEQNLCKLLKLNVQSNVP